MVDMWVGPYITLALQKLSNCESRVLKDNLVLVVANALYYNPVLTLQALQAQNAVSQFLGGWFGMIMAKKPNGKPKHFKRMQDKKVGGVLRLAQLNCGMTWPGFTVWPERFAQLHMLQKWVGMPAASDGLFQTQSVFGMYSEP